jgi:hypothetical protein
MFGVKSKTMEEEETHLSELPSCHETVPNSIDLENRNVETNLLKGYNLLHLQDELNDLTLYDERLNLSMKKWNRKRRMTHDMQITRGDGGKQNESQRK